MQTQMLDQVKTLVQTEQLRPEQFNNMDKLIQQIGLEIQTGRFSKSDIASLNECFSEEFLQQTIQGHGLRKPFGYAGDFLIIDKIYTQHTSAHPKYKVWDEYFHLQEAPKAVRNRKEYFKAMIQTKAAEHPNLSLLNIASGPARDLYEMYSDLPACCNVQTTCVEMDKNAIAYAKRLNKDFLDKVNFVQQNIFKHREASTYDVIWSAGLFDYFEDKAFVLILKRFKTWANAGGEIIIGNFNESHNPSRHYMEIFGDWYLHHRTEGQLIELAEQAGFRADQIRVGKEPENVNLFLHLQVD